MSSTAATSRAELTRLFRRPGYVGFVLTVSLSRIGVTMFGTAGVLLVLSRTGSPALAGLTAAAATLPGAIAGPVLGAWLDVARSRRVLMVFDQLTSVIGLLAIVALAGHAPNWTVPAVTGLYSITRPFSAGSFFSAVAEVAGPELLDQASAMEASSLNFSFVIGPAIAGVLAGAAGPAAAIEVEAAVMLVSTVLIALNPVFELRGAERAESARHALRDGTRALRAAGLLRATTVAGTLAAFGWGLMMVGFPLYAAKTLHAGAHAGGYLWAALALGSIIGTFALAGQPSPTRIALSYGILGLSALAWPVVHELALGIALVGLTGFLEGPAYSGSIAVRQRYAPPAIRAQLQTTISGIGLVASSAGAAIGGLSHHPFTLFVLFVAINALAALMVLFAGRTPTSRAAQAADVAR
jgi:MFS family permease